MTRKERASGRRFSRKFAGIAVIFGAAISATLSLAGCGAGSAGSAGSGNAGPPKVAEPVAVVTAEVEEITDDQLEARKVIASIKQQRDADEFRQKMLRISERADTLEKKRRLAREVEQLIQEVADGKISSAEAIKKAEKIEL